MKTPSYQVNINLRRDPALYNQLRILAERKERKLAALGKIALRQYVARHAIETKQEDSE